MPHAVPASRPLVTGSLRMPTGAVADELAYTGGSSAIVALLGLLAAAAGLGLTLVSRGGGRGEAGSEDGAAFVTARTLRSRVHG